MASFRFFFAACSASFLALVACGGSTNSGLFGPSTCGDAACPATEPSGDGGGLTDAGTNPDPPSILPDGAVSDANVKPDDAATGGGPCNRDVECATGLCNLETDKCSVPGANGTPCFRDKECAGALCNLQTNKCSPLGVDGDACFRDQECAGALCNLQQDKCRAKQPFGEPCFRDKECILGLCNTSLNVCM